ncbi:MAG: hypothetical protein JXR53_10040 [Bacteroidales bacterium]|nr:hypothetical protein [Bacteroidales bacterium]
MQQFMDNYISAYRLTFRALDDFFPVDKEKGRMLQHYSNVSYWLKWLSPIFFIPLTHEEGHRSILTAQGIGSISQPWPNIHGVCYVKGVSNATLQNLRDNQLPVFIRLHTAGIESDYEIIRKEKELISFKQETTPGIGVELAMREIMNMVYMFYGLFEIDMNLTEEVNELDRDIVGHDIYGMAYHLFRPNAAYSRYKDFDDLSQEEVDFVKRIGWKSFINMASPFHWVKNPVFNLTDNMYITGHAGYCIAPFGDFIDEHIYFTYKDLHLTAYARQFQNRYNWFPAFGAGLVDFKPLDWLAITARGHFWMQPEELDFNTANAMLGGAVELELTGYLPSRNPDSFMNIQAIGLSLGCLYKTKGFMPGIEQHEDHLRISAGVAFRY